MITTRNSALWWCLSLLLFVGTMTITRLDSSPIFNDEYHSVRHTGVLDDPFNISQIIESVASTSSQHVPFYFILLSGWIFVTGVDPITMRLFSLFPFMLSISLSYQLGKNLLDKEYGKWVAFFVAMSGFSIFYAHQIRMYDFLLLFCLWFIWSYWRVWLSGKRVSYLDWFSLWLSTILLLYTHYIGIIALISVGIYHLIQFRFEKRWWSIVLVEVLAGSTFLFWLETFISGASNRKDLSDGALSFVESIYHILNVSSNGVFIMGFGTYCSCDVFMAEWQKHSIHSICRVFELDSSSPYQ